MKTIIHDLDESYDSLFKSKYESVIHADGRYAPCQGCFGCWTKHPGQCYLKDALQKVSCTIGKTEELVIVTENYYGSYSPSIKNVLDRSIGVSTPFSTYRGKQMHHTLRYGKKNKLSVYAYGCMTENEKQTFCYMVERNAINYGFQEFEFHNLHNLNQMEKMNL